LWCEAQLRLSHTTAARTLRIVLTAAVLQPACCTPLSRVCAASAAWLSLLSTMFWFQPTCPVCHVLFDAFVLLHVRRKGSTSVSVRRTV